jgi:hypothetical protein
MDWTIFLLGLLRGINLVCFCNKQMENLLGRPNQDLDKDSVYEDIDASWADVNNDGFQDLFSGKWG